MFMRAFFLSAAVLALAAPTAGAAIADQVVPVYDADDGVTAGQTAHGTFLRFGPKAAKLYRRFAGHTVRVGCGRPSAKDDGTSGFTGSTDGTQELYGDGYLSEDRRMPRTRGRVGLGYVGDPYDVCFIATKRRTSDDICLPVSAPPYDEDRCVRLLVALTPQGVADIDERSRVIELGELFGAPIDEAQKEFGADIVVLDSPDASPPVGKVGLYEVGANTAAVAMLRDGRRLFVRQDGEVYSTNVGPLSGGEDVFSLI
ncbi:hypothetical protein OM076_20985 [Solirubrobacter ginsenosidimutans]|uniref:Uncharacterized protein n=1 Tax=Solirubrobacter ginsenosidimutans TaxID=490573 RepID=A0A9X3MVX3_9ACTN|nr:hypothetical protein [Solirubrobacter ginsenosidimutans]MDA0162761.1 hypothetical protein [Solirubrobacter ginsenosidimutans]